jgi:putative tricarboxylic transport membrane protein
MDRRGDIIFAAVVAAYGAIMVLLTSQLNPGPTFDPLGKLGLPYVIGFSLIILGGVLVVRRLRTWREETSNTVYDEGVEDEAGHPASAARAMAIGGGTVAYAFLLPPVGFLIGTPIFIILGLYLMRVRNRWLLGVTPIVFTLVVFIVFSQLLGVPLPVGPLTDPLIDLGWIDAIR